ncbi:MAG TPA: ATP synthase F0 subunit B [Flavobacteriales bacterium]|jgi:F-type H+-transporting ATPase subunit b|nr:F0F1 ATP synthase subunit B [Flavobacteriales bacterium]HIG58703.1 F0F1 ATP synthase subunit B [Flavobacteriales bacterium]HIK68175.1 ATP synthase F0 subunit B [Flavobacteriales bacterium]
MEQLLSPAFGTVFWATIAFLSVLYLLRRMAWGPILQALSDREESIEKALREADKAREEMANLHADNEQLLSEARLKRDAMLKESREMADKVVSDAKTKAKEEASKEVEIALEAIQIERKAAIAELKAEVAKLSIDIAERLLREELTDSGKQKTLVDKLIEESTLK